MGCTHSTLSPSLPWRTKLKIFLLKAITDRVCRPDGTINRRLAALGDVRSAPTPQAARGVRTTDVTIDPARGLWVRLFLPAAAPPAPLPLLVFFHGGGFAFLSAATREYDAACRRFCRRLSVAVISVNYRLSPEHPFPAQHDDGVDVLRFLQAYKPVDDPFLSEFFRAADLSNCFLAGDSAGATIAHHVARRWTGGENRRVGLAGLISIQPFFGGEARVESELRLPDGPVVTVDRTDWLWKVYLPKGATRDHPAANPSLASEGLGLDFPPVMVVVGGFDPLQDWQRKYFQSLRKNGKDAEIVEYPTAIHAFYVFPELKDSSPLIDDMKSFIQRQIGRRLAREKLSMTTNEG